MRIAICTMTVLLTVLCSNASAAAESARCDIPQNVSLSWNGTHISDWEATENEIKPFTLPNGYNLGIKIGAADKNDLVEISLYDMSSSETPLLTHTYGGTNSIQGYGARGGADRVEELGDPGILLQLTRTSCEKAAKAELAG